MTRQVLIFQSDQQAIDDLRRFFHRRGAVTWQAKTDTEAVHILFDHQPDLVLIDLHLPVRDWSEFLAQVRRHCPNAAIIATSRTPDVRLELIAREEGIKVFLRAPFKPQWIQRALDKLNQPEEQAGSTNSSNTLPHVRVPMRLKITVPYVILASIFVFTAAFFVSRYVLESIQERFINQLIDSGKQTSDWMVREENRLLSTQRLITHTEGLVEALQLGDSERLRQITLPLVINSQEETIEIIDSQGVSRLSLRHKAGGNREDYAASQGDNRFASWGFVQKALKNQADARGDKYAGVERTPWGNYFYIVGPVTNAEGRPLGAVLVGESLSSLTRQIHQDVMAQVSLYDFDGNVQVSTLFQPDQSFPLPTGLAQDVLTRQDSAASVRDLQVGSVQYSELLGPWEARGGEDLGVMGISLAQNFLARPNPLTGVQAVLFVVLAFIGIILLGLITSRHITSPLSKVVQASTEVAEGNFQVKVPSEGNDEVMVLAHAFNYMVTELQEGSIYRDLLGRSVSPEVREALRQSFASGNLRLEGRNTVATVLMSDIRNFTALSEKEEPTTVLKWLNEYFCELVPVITRHEGVVDKFEGDAMLAFFGILPTPLSPEDSAYQACQAAVEMLTVLEKINNRRKARGEPLLITGIGINTGMLTAGGLGTKDRMNFTIIGDTVNSTQRLQGMTRDFGESAVVIGENTLAALHGRRGIYLFEPLGAQSFKGKSEPMWVYRLRPYIENRGLNSKPGNNNGHNGNGHKDARVSLETGDWVVIRPEKQPQ